MQTRRFRRCCAWNGLHKSMSQLLTSPLATELLMAVPTQAEVLVVSTAGAHTHCTCAASYTGWVPPSVASLTWRSTHQRRRMCLWRG